LSENINNLKENKEMSDYSQLLEVEKECKANKYVFDSSFKLTKRDKESWIVFLWNLIHSYSYRWATYAEGSRKGQMGSSVCSTGRHRSLTDLYSIVVSYFPDARLENVRRVLGFWLKEKEIYYMHCPDISKGTYFPINNSKGYSNYCNGNEHDENGWSPLKDIAIPENTEPDILSSTAIAEQTAVTTAALVPMIPSRRLVS
jgi:hypothetical protein